MSKRAKQCRACQRRAATGRKRGPETRARLSFAASARWERSRGSRLDAADLRARVAAGETITQIAASVKASRSAVSIIVNYGSFAEYHRQKGTT